MRRLFSLTGISEHLIFKGGTSLSKAFGVIDRFSEDIDLSIHRKLLGFTGENDPENAKSAKKQKEKIEELGEACEKFVKDALLKALGQEIQKLLGTQANWTLETDPSDPDQQSLLFSYPSEKTEGAVYISPKVKIEMGARSDHWPAGDHAITPYVSVHVPKDAIPDSQTTAKVMEIERTFWEKATILHEYAHYPEDKKPRPRQSRHYYDFFRLLNSKYKDESVKRVDLLKRVSEHKQIYFRSARAKYEDAKPGTLKLVPPTHVFDEMKRDYVQMGEMIFSKPPAWDDIIGGVRQFEIEFNKTTVEKQPDKTSGET